MVECASWEILSRLCSVSTSSRHKWCLCTTQNPEGEFANLSPEGKLAREFHTFQPMDHFPDELHQYPSHLHIDILPRAQGRGFGTLSSFLKPPLPIQICVAVALLGFLVMFMLLFSPTHLHTPHTHTATQLAHPLLSEVRGTNFSCLVLFLTNHVRYNYDTSCVFSVSSSRFHWGSSGNEYKEWPSSSILQETWLQRVTEERRRRCVVPGESPVNVTTMIWARTFHCLLDRC